MKTSVQRRSTSLLAGTIAATLLLAACGGGSQPADSEPDADADQSVETGETAAETDGAAVKGELAVAVYGGPTTDTWTNVFGASFKDSHPDIDLNISGVPNPSSLLFTQEGDVQFDLVLATGSDIAQLGEQEDKLYLPIDPSKLERSSAIREDFLAEEEDGNWTGVPVALTFYGIAYNTEVHEASDIKSWADLADPKFEGTYLMNGPSFFSTTDLPMFALASGGDSTNLEPGFELLKETLPNVRGIATDLASSASQMESEAVTVAPFFFSQYSQLVDSDVPVALVLPEEGGYASPLFLVMSADTKNEAAAYAFLDSILSAELQEEVQEPASYIPVVTDAPVIDKIKERSGYDDVDALMEDLVFPDYGYLASVREENTQRIEDMIAES